MLIWVVGLFFALTWIYFGRFLTKSRWKYLDKFVVVVDHRVRIVAFKNLEVNLVRSVVIMIALSCA